MNYNEKIIHQIEINKLDGMEYGFVIGQLCVLNNKPYEEMTNVVEKLVSNGYLVKDQKNMLTIHKKKQKQKSFSKKDRPMLTKEEEFLQQADQMIFKDVKKGKRKQQKRIEGKISSTSKGYAFLVPYEEGMEDIFIAQKNLGGALHNDMVIVELIPSRGHKMEGKVVQILERGQNTVVGKINLMKKVAYVTPDDVKFGKDILIPISQTLGANQGDKVVVTITKYGTGKKKVEGIVTEVLGQPNKIETEVLAIIRSYGLFLQFPKKVQEFAQTIPQEISTKDSKNRKDFRKELIFTIDGEDTRDIDDAISLQKLKNGHYQLGVHIADVGEYVPRNSILDKEAFHRATSVYFPSLVLPMLPRELSNGICSLNEGVDRFALSCIMEIDETGTVVNYDICESVIRSKKRFTYTIVQAILDGDPLMCKQYKEFVTPLQQMNELNHILIDHRNKRGNIEFNLPEVEIHLNDLGDVLEVVKKERKDAHKLIESFMIVANETIAEHFQKHKIPFVYRVHETPSSEKMQVFLNMVSKVGIKTSVNAAKVHPKDLQRILNQVKDLDCQEMINKIALRSMKKAKYSPDCLGHFGLASTYYCHFTSPIRRYPDLTIHRIIKDYLHGVLQSNKLAETRNFVLASSVQSSEREVLAESVERDVDDLYKTFYMQHHLQEVFEGKVSSVTPFGIFVQLENTVEGLVKLTDIDDVLEYDEENFMLKGKKYQFTIGTPLKVKAVRADILSREIDMVMVEYVNKL